MLHFRSCPPEEEHAHTGESLISVTGGIGEGSGSMKERKKTCAAISPRVEGRGSVRGGI